MDHINEEKKLTEEEVRAVVFAISRLSTYNKEKKIKKHLTKVSKCGKEFYEKI